MKEVARVYANVKELARNHHICLRNTLSYVNTLTNYGVTNNNRAGQIIVLCKKEQNRSHNGHALLVPKLEGNDKNSSDYIGSPLRDTCTIDTIDESFNLIELPRKPWEEDEEYLKGIPQSEAAQILSNMAAKVNDEGNCTIWSVCECGPQNILLSFRTIRPDRFHRGCVYFNGLVTHESIQMKALVAKHYQYIAQKSSSVSINIDSYFSLQNSNNVTLQVSRSTSGHVSQSYLTDNTICDDMILHQNIPVGDPSSLAIQFWMELHMLNSIKEDILRYKESEDPNDLIYSMAVTRDTKIETIKQQIIQLICDVQITDDGSDDSSRSKEIDTVIERASVRSFAEITDQLWTILKWCSCYADLLAAFNFLFISIAKNSVINIPSSKNGVAFFIREICEQRLAVPLLKGTEPLELLIEIGLEKLQRDYAFIFSEIGFATKEEFQLLVNCDKTANEAMVPNFTVRKTLANVNGGDAARTTSHQRKTLMHSKIGESDRAEEAKAGLQNSVFNLEDIERKLAKLAQVHLILEHMLFIRTNLDMDTLYTRSSFLSDTKEPAVPFDVVKNKKINTREIIINNEKILSKIENEKPQGLRIVFYSENSTVQARNTFYYSSSPIFPPSAFPCMQFDDILAEDQYYSHHLLDISTLHC